MRTQAAFSSNSTLAYKSGHGTNGIQDELSCSISLSQVRVMVGEWIPFGPNQIVTLNERLGSLNRCQGGLFTSEIDTFPTSTCLNINPGLTKIAIVDFDFASFTNLEADIQWPEQDGIVQIESFGMHIDGNGTIVYGMNVEAIMDKSADSIFVDHLSRLLVDVHSDSSKIINDLLSSHQRQLLDMLFMEDAVSRSKYSLITGKKITPKLPAKKYLDKSEMENELKQVLGEIISTHDLSEDDIIIIGQDGMLLLGPNCDRHEGLMIAYLTLLSHDLLIRCLFKKTFMLDEILNRARIYLRHYEKNPNALNTTRARLNQCSHDLILLEEVLELLRDAMESFNLPKCPPDDEGKRLFYHLKLSKMLSDLDIRCRDLVKILRGFRAKLKQVQSQNSNMAKTILETAIRGVDKNFGVVSEHRKKHESIMQHSFDFLLFLFGCTLSFDALDRLTNGITLGSSILSKNNGDYPMTWANNFIYDGILTHPLLWFVLNILWVCACILCVRKLLQYIYQKKEDLRIDSFKVNEKVNVNALENLLSSFNIKTETCTIGIETRIIKVRSNAYNFGNYSEMTIVG
jgi:WD repeat-containing protein 35